MKYESFKNRKKVSQQLIEFFLVIPFIVIIIGVVTEFAYALYVRSTVEQALKTASASLYKEMDIDFGYIPLDVSNFIEDRMNNYLSQYNIPTSYEHFSQNALKVDFVNIGDTSVFIAAYKYRPGVSLPTVYFHILPKEMNFMLISAVPRAFVTSNTIYKDRYDSEMMDEVWGADEFSSLASFEKTKNGVMKDLNAANDKMVFLSPLSTVLPKTYAIISWAGTIYTSIIQEDETDYDKDGKPFLKKVDYTAYRVLSTNDGQVYDCTSKNCYETGSRASSYLGSYSNIVFVHDSALTANMSMIEANLASSWKNTILPNVLSLVAGGQSIGNYDNIDINTFNSIIGAARSYTITPRNSKLYVYKTNEDSISNISY